MHHWSQWLFYASLAALGILLVRFLSTGLYKIYSFLFCYFGAVLIGGVVLVRIPYHSNSYMSAFSTIEVVNHVLAILVVLEMYRIALAGHTGLAEFGRAGILSATVLAVTVAAAISLLDRSLPAGQSANVHRLVTLQRSGDLTVVVFLLIIGTFITWFPVEMSKNTALGIAGFSVIFFVRAGVLLIANLLPLKRLPTINDAAMILETAMMLAWAALIRPEKTKEQVVPGHFWNPGDWDRLNQQLDSINAALGRFVRH